MVKSGFRDLKVQLVMHKRNMHHLFNIFKTVSLASPCLDGHKIIQFHEVSRENLQSLTQIFVQKAVFIGISQKVLVFTFNFKSYKQQLSIELKLILRIVEKIQQNTELQELVGCPTTGFLSPFSQNLWKKHKYNKTRLSGIQGLGMLLKKVTKTVRKA